jgi:signal transduction histidine kinase
LRDTHVVLEEKVRERTSELLGAYRRVVSIQDDERRRISRDLHDQIGQRITALRLQLETLEAGRRVKPDRSQDGRLLEAAIESVEALDREVDSLTWALRPPALDQFGLTAALQDFVQKWAATFDVRADFIACGPSSPRLSPLVEGNVYQIVQEALNNIHKHARARSVRVSLERRTSEILLAIEDDGIGFDPAHTDDAHGIGLVGMRERTVLMGGTLGISSALGRGTKITACVPVEGGQW